MNPTQKQFSLSGVSLKNQFPIISGRTPMKSNSTSTGLVFALLLLPVATVHAQGTAASVALWGTAPRNIYSDVSVPPGLTNCLLDSGLRPIGQCRAQGLTNGSIGISVFMPADENRGLDVYSGASAGFSDIFELQLQDAMVYGNVDSTVLQLRLHGSIKVAPPLGYAMLKVAVGYTRNGTSDCEYGELLATEDNNGWAQWTAYNDVTWYPRKTNLFLHPLNASRYPLNQEFNWNQPQAIDLPFFAVLPGIGPLDITGQYLSVNMSGTVSASGADIEFYDTLNINQANPVVFYSAATGKLVPLATGDQYRSAGGIMGPVAWSSPVIPTPRLTLQYQQGQLVLSWPTGLDLNYRPQVNSDLNNSAGWLDIGQVPSTNGPNYSLSLSLSAQQQFYRLKAGN